MPVSKERFPGWRITNPPTVKLGHAKLLRRKCESRRTVPEPPKGFSPSPLCERRAPQPADSQWVAEHDRFAGVLLSPICPHSPPPTCPRKPLRGQIGLSRLRTRESQRWRLPPTRTRFEVLRLLSLTFVYFYIAPQFILNAQTLYHDRRYGSALFTFLYSPHGP